MFFDLDNIYLRELRKSDLEGNWYKWFNDEEVTKFQDKKIYPNTYEKQLDYYSYLQNTDSDVVMAIVDKKTDLHIGNIGLHKINYIHSRAEIGIVIGEKNFWGKDVGTKSIQTFTKYAFDTLNLNRVTSIIMSENISSLKAFEKSSYLVEGRLQSYFYKNGNYVDAIIMAKIRNKSEN